MKKISIIRYSNCDQKPYSHERSVLDMQNYLETVTAVLKLMREPDSPCKDVKPYRTCYVSLFKYLLEEELPFSVDTAMNWLESKTNDLSPESYANYRKALFRLEHYLLFGNIKTPFCHSDDFLFCRSGMSESFYRLISTFPTS